MAAGSEQEGRTRRGLFGAIRKVDDAVFAVEQAIVALALMTITVVVFVDVIARRINAPDSKVGQLISKIAGITDFEARDRIDQEVAPWVTLGVSMLLLTFGVYTARRFARRRKAKAVGERFELLEAKVSKGREAGIAILGAAAVVAAAWGLSLLFQQLDSWMVYAAVFGGSAAAYAGVAAWKKPEGWPLKLGAAVLVGATLVWLSIEYVPLGYTWSKKVSLMLLLWVGMLSASICVHAGKHIRMEAATKIVPEKVRPYVVALGMAATAVFCAIMAYLGFQYVFAPKPSDEEFMQEMITLFGTRYVYGFEGMVGRGGYLEGTDIPDWLGILSAPIGFGIATLRFAGASVSSLLGGTYGAAAPEEGLEEARQFAEGGEAEAAGVEKAAETTARAEAEAETEAESEPEAESDDDDERGGGR